MDGHRAAHTANPLRDGGGVVMFLYSGLLILLNRRFLPEPIKLKSWRLVGMVISFSSYYAD
jgi:hypothetical protein